MYTLFSWVSEIVVVWPESTTRQQTQQFCMSQSRKKKSFWACAKKGSPSGNLCAFTCCWATKQSRYGFKAFVFLMLCTSAGRLFLLTPILQKYFHAKVSIYYFIFTEFKNQNFLCFNPQKSNLIRLISLIIQKYWNFFKFSVHINSGKILVFSNYHNLFFLDLKGTDLGFILQFWLQYSLWRDCLAS